ncbi:MAG TPA: hypothetical protein VK895_02300, partial [Jiangellaceae bacterium]|nr:hypothetical protein [Jiangellaceae bacterium]
MSERNRRDDGTGDDVHRDGEPSPPYPGWSSEQPPAEGWTAPGQQSAWTGQQSGWTAPAGQEGRSAPGQQSPESQPPGRQSEWTAPGGQSGG